jgi:hypothetical protein
MFSKEKDKIQFTWIQSVSITSDLLAAFFPSPTSRLAALFTSAYTGMSSDRQAAISFFTAAMVMVQPRDLTPPRRDSLREQQQQQRRTSL